MGFGEKHWHEWCSLFSALPDAERTRYQINWPEPEDWKGFYQFIQTGEAPPWYVERQQRIAAAARAPDEGETEIRDPDRIAWMLQTYLKTPKTVARLWGYGCSDHLYCDPHGNTWCLCVPTNGQVAHLYRYEGALIGEDNLEVKRPIS